MLKRTGGRETEALLEGMPIMPRTRSNIAARRQAEMDLDAILVWHPQIAVVDELAHTNAPGSRHPKRSRTCSSCSTQGIDVYHDG